MTSVWIWVTKIGYMSSGSDVLMGFFVLISGFGGFVGVLSLACRFRFEDGKYGHTIVCFLRAQLDG